jgi:arabinogalactan oligomer/maltooligosaccharide transport system substrate-binding protein
MRRTAVAGALGLAGALIAVTVGVAPAVQAAATPIVIWADATRASVLETKFASGYDGHPVKIVVKDMAAIRGELKTVAPDSAPDVIWADHDWTGELASAGLILKLPLAAAMRARFPARALDGFKFGFNYYGIPVQYENVALITNAALIPTPPATFAVLNKSAIALKKAGTVDVGVAVAQGSGGNAYFMNPFFTGLGGYIFGKNAAGSLDPYNIGIDNPTFTKNMGKIDKWNASGLINSALDDKAATAAFISGRAPYWITGAWNRAELSALTFKYRISALPAINTGIIPSPFLTIKGFMVTAFADQHGVLKSSQGVVRKVLTGAGIQSKIAALTERVPANLSSSMGRLAQAFAAAGTDGVATPNIPQAAGIWAPLGKAWATSTQGAGAVPAKQAFAEAQIAVEQSVG